MYVAQTRGHLKILIPRYYRVLVLGRYLGTSKMTPSLLQRVLIYTVVI